MGVTFTDMEGFGVLLPGYQQQLHYQAQSQQQSSMKNILHLIQILFDKNLYLVLVRVLATKQTHMTYSYPRY